MKWNFSSKRKRWILTDQCWLLCGFQIINLTFAKVSQSDVFIQKLLGQFIRQATKIGIPKSPFSISSRYIYSSTAYNSSVSGAKNPLSLPKLLRKISLKYEEIFDGSDAKPHGGSPQIWGICQYLAKHEEIFLSIQYVHYKILLLHLYTWVGDAWVTISAD